MTKRQLIQSTYTRGSDPLKPGLTDLACYLDPLDADAVEVMARQLQISSIITTPSSRASATEAAVGARLGL